jgi:hypothetical protein
MDFATHWNSRENIGVGSFINIVPGTWKFEVWWSSQMGTQNRLSLLLSSGLFTNSFFIICEPSGDYLYVEMDCF